MVCCLLSGVGIPLAFSQNTFQPKPIEETRKGVIYNKETTVDLRIFPRGYSISLNFGKIKTYYKTNYYQFEFGEIKHPKEYRLKSYYNYQFSSTSKSYIYGKQNNLFVLKAGMGSKYYLTDKAKEKGVIIGINYEFGPTLGILKPYYIQLNNEVNNSFETIKYNSQDTVSPNPFLDVNRIVGSGGIVKGWGQVQFVPGLHAKIAAHFSIGKYDDFVKALEVGVAADLFIKKMPIMVIENNRPLFINFYINVQLGKRL